MHRISTIPTLLYLCKYSKDLKTHVCNLSAHIGMHIQLHEVFNTASSMVGTINLFNKFLLVNAAQYFF